MNKLHLHFLLMISALWSHGQPLGETLILRGNKNSALSKAESMIFDKEGNYLIQMKLDNGQYLFIQNQDTIGPLNFMVGSSISKFTEPSNHDIVYYQYNSPKLIGPIKGVDIANHRHPESRDARHIAIPLWIKDNVIIYLDDNIIHAVDTFSKKEWSIDGVKATPFQAKKQHFRSNEWMSVSQSGNYLMSLEHGSRYILYFNNQPIDSSENNFYQLRVNDKGDYIYAKGRRPHKDEPYKYSYMFFLHTKDSVFGPVRTAWNCYLMNNGGYYFTGDDDGPKYILINNTLYRDIYSISDITINDKTHYLFTYKQNGKAFINLNGKSYELNYERIFHPTLDNEGNFALYGLRDYYMYKFVNGKEAEAPITNYGVRPVPLYISSVGKSFTTSRQMIRPISTRIINCFFRLLII